LTPARTTTCSSPTTTASCWPRSGACSAWPRRCGPFRRSPDCPATPASRRSWNGPSRDQHFALLYADLDNFKAYNDHYGFARGDDVLRLAARLLQAAVQAAGQSAAFVGHVGGDDFVAITDEEAAKAVVEHLVERFDAEVGSLYDPPDAQQGYVEVENRRGRLERFPIVTISVGVASTASRRFCHYAEAVAAATEMKSVAKQQQGSGWAVDRRSS
jgi:diguanylate cyclase (GGDEF)-like protein